MTVEMKAGHFYQAEPGDRIVLLDPQYEFAVAAYAPIVEERYIYTYSYAPEQAWLTYSGGLDSWLQEPYTFENDCYFRINIRRTDGGDITDINNVLSFKKKEALRFVLLTDSHYNVNGTWNRTAGDVWAASRRQKFDGIIHLGDITDGMVSRERCKDYVNIVLDDLRATGLPVWVALGNHDCNYFKNNPEPMSEAEQCALYLGRGKPRYTVDFAPHKLKMIFLDSFDPSEPLRYGYSTECLTWLENALNETPQDWCFLLFSHLPPTARLQFWVEAIRGEKELSGLLSAHKHRILAWINGHNHADMLDNGEGFPIISINNAKCEAFTERKPEGYITPERRLGDRTQECWDILTIDAAEKTLRFKRQGAGNERIIRNGRVEWA